jgi:sec-independent protein translocase protein TatB
MFDLTSSKLLLLGIVALLVIGPKDFPVLLRSIGKYVGIIRGHAREFRAQFDEAMRESELDQLKKDVEKIASETEASMADATRSIEQTADEARRTMDAQGDLPKIDLLAHDANGLPMHEPQPVPAVPTASDPAPQAAAASTSTDQPAPSSSEPSPSARPAERSGA